MELVPSAYHDVAELTVFNRAPKGLFVDAK